MNYRTNHDRTELLTFVAIVCIIAFMLGLISCCPKSGKDGAAGKPGLDAPPTEVITTPASLADCPGGGTRVLFNDVGINVCNGLVGSIGATGATGEDSAPVTIVNLCPGHTAYPAVFIEVALCLNGSLYGIYSANGGFLTYFPPGNYTSNAIGSACNLTVGANCQISH